MVTVAPDLPDRRQRRRQETIEEILDLAMDVMAEQGVAGLSLGEVARRMGIRPPSLYGYFPSKHALYDAVFARGARSIVERLTAAYPAARQARPLTAGLLLAAREFADWCLTNPVYAQLLFWRTVPGFTPSDEAYAPAVELIELTRGLFTDFRRAGLIRRGADLDGVMRDWTILVSGVISQQMANGPDEDLETGRFTAALPSLVAMFATAYGTAARPAPRARPKGAADARQS